MASGAGRSTQFLIGGDAVVVSVQRMGPERDSLRLR
jgi:hypothetical protein